MALNGIVEMSVKVPLSAGEAAMRRPFTSTSVEPSPKPRKLAVTEPWVKRGDRLS